jgi:hypothetical protein
VLPQSATRTSERGIPVRNRTEVTLAVLAALFGAAPGLANADDPTGACCDQATGDCAITWELHCCHATGVRRPEWALDW